MMSAGRRADIIVRLPDGYELFEIKTALAPRDCVREALSQLLEYAYWPGSPDFIALWIVGPSPIDSETQQYLDGLRERFGLPVGYRHQPVATPVLVTGRSTHPTAGGPSRYFAALRNLVAIGA